MQTEPAKKTLVGPVVRAYSRAAFRYPKMLLLAVVGTLGMQVVSIAIPLYMKQLIDMLAAQAPSAEVVQALLIIIAIYAGLGVLNWLSRRLQMVALMYIEANAMADLANDAFASLLKRSHDFFLSNFSGTLTRRVTRYSRSFEQVFDGVILNFLPMALFMVGSITILSMRSIWLGIMLFVWAMSFLLVQFIMTRWRQPQRVERSAADSRITGTLSDVIGNHSAVTLFASSVFEKKVFADVVEVWRAITRKSWFGENVTQGVQQALSILVEVGLLILGVTLWQKGIITVGDFVLIRSYLFNLMDQVWGIGYVLRRMYDAFADASEMVEIMQQPLEITESSTARPLLCSSGAIEFKDVSFSYSEDRTIFSNLALVIKGGEKVAFVGSSGAGKSTLTQLLLRLYDVKSGHILIDDQDIRDVTLDSLRQAIAFVPQEPILFHRTLRENIAYGKRDATEEEIVEAAKRAHCHEFISVLPQGYDTYVGERGVKLSGGERQRVAIARAILKNAPILVLDEATSSLDSESEALIKDALDKLMEGKTVIAIAHRLSTIMKMDRIVVMEAGRVVLTGTHAELLAGEDNLYKKLWDIQAGGFLASQNNIEEEEKSSDDEEE